MKCGSLPLMLLTLFLSGCAPALISNHDYRNSEAEFEMQPVERPIGTIFHRKALLNAKDKTQEKNAR